MTWKTAYEHFVPVVQRKVSYFFSDVNKDLTSKAKDLTAKAKTKDLSFKNKAKDLTFKAKDLTFNAKPSTYVARQQYWSLCFLHRFISII